MSFRDCIGMALSSGVINAAQHAQVQKMLDYHEGLARNEGLGEAEAQARAAKKVQELAAANYGSKKLATGLAFQKFQKMITDIDNFKQLKLDGGGKPNAARAMAALVEDDPGAITGFNSAKSIAKNNLRRYTNIMQPFINRYGSGLFTGLKRAGELKDVVDELYGKSSGNAAAKDAADSVMKAREAMRRDANSLGANIDELKNYGMRMIYNPVRISEIGRDQFVKDVLENIDEHRTEDYNNTPFAALSQADKEAFVQKAWENIKTQGFLKANKGISPLSDSMSMQRWFHWKDGDAWAAMNKKYGDGDAFASILHDTEMMSRQIAMLDRFGPNPHAAWQYLKEGVLKGAAHEDTLNIDPSTRQYLEDAKKEMNRSDDIFSMFTGQNSPFRTGALFHTMNGLNNLIATALVIPRVILKELPTDMVRGMQMHYIAKMPITGFIDKWMKGLTDSELPKRLNLLNESSMGHRLAQQRYMGDMMGGFVPKGLQRVLSPGWTSRTYDFMSRITGFNAMIQSGRWSHEMAMLGQFADDAGKSFEELPYRKSLERSGISAAEWDKFRSVTPYDYNGAKFLRPDDLLAKNKDIADKFMIHVMDESQRAIPDASLRVRSAWLGGAKAGTWPYAILHGAVMWKNFGLTLYHQWMRGLMLQEGTGAKLGYAAATQMGYLLSGAIGYQLYQLAAGKNPINMNPATAHGRNFWYESLLKGGGLSVLGDILSNVEYGGGKGLAGATEAPIQRLVGDLWDTTGAQVGKKIEGKPTDFGASAIKFANNYTPVPWYAQLAVKNAMMGQAQKQIDPKFAQKQRATLTRMQNTYGQSYFYPPGGNIKSPDLTQAWQKR